MTRIAICLAAAAWVVALGCQEEKAVTPGKAVTPESKPSEIAGATRIVAKVGEKVILTAPSKPVHPRYADAKVKAELNRDLLRLAGETTDTERLGAATQKVEVEVLKPGTSEVTLNLVLPDGTVEKTVKYVIEGK